MEKKSEETTSSPQDEKNTLPDQKLKEEFLEKFRRSCPVEIEKFLFCKRSKTPDNIRKECHSFALDMLMCGGRVFCNEAYYEVIKCCQSEEVISFFQIFFLIFMISTFFFRK